MKIACMLALGLAPVVTAQEPVLEIGPGAVVTFPHHEIMSTTDRFTVEWWMAASPGATGRVWPFWRYSPSQEHKATQVTPDGRVRFLYAGSPWAQDFETGTTLSTEDGAFPADGTWHHVAFVRHMDGAYEVYVDGLVAHAGGPGPCWLTCDVINSHAAPTEVLRGDSEASGWRLRDLRVSSIDRYSGAFLPVADNAADAQTALLLPLDEGSGTTVFDHGPAAQVGEITGTFQWVADTTASVAYRLGSGVNPVLYKSTALPLLGTLWTALFDTTGATSGEDPHTFIAAASAPSIPLTTAFGEILIAVPPLGGVLLFSSQVSIFGPAAYHVIGVPSSPALAGARHRARRLGPASMEVVSDPRFFERVEGRRAQAQPPSLEDAILGEIFDRAREQPHVADEFLRFIARELAGIPRVALSPRLRKLMDPSDLVQSVLGDLCSSFEDLRYENRAKFVALLARRVRWKHQDHERRLLRLRRSEDLRVEAPQDLGFAATAPSPATSALGHEEAGRIALAIARLRERDRELLRMHMRGEDHEGIAARSGLSPNAVRKALQRARERLRAALEKRQP